MWRRKLGGIFDAWGGWKAWPIDDRVVNSNGSARSHSIKTPQSTLVRLGWCWIAQGTEKRLRFVACIFSEFPPHSIATGRMNLIAPPGC
jgi:hypothetical protein